jgi:hypothetical protein
MMHSDSWAKSSAQGSLGGLGGSRPVRTGQDRADGDGMLARKTKARSIPRFGGGAGVPDDFLWPERMGLILLLLEVESGPGRDKKRSWTHERNYTGDLN